MAKIVTKNLSRGRRYYQIKIPNLGVAKVWDIPAPSLTKKEWELITLARQSYNKMWGGGKVFKKIVEDPFDGRVLNSPYITRHQIAQFVSLNGQKKILTNRKVSLAKPNAPIFDDLAFWQVNGKPLWEIVKERIGSNPETNITAISRTGTFPFSPKSRNDRDHDKSAIAWALMQVATTDEDNHKYFVCQLCLEFQEKVLNIDDYQLDFTRTEIILGIPQVKLDRKNLNVQALMFNFPGYWTNNKDLLKVLQNFNLENLPYSLEIITKPRFCKYLVPTINQIPELQSAILRDVGDGPFSSMLIPQKWRESALGLIDRAIAKYA